MGRPFVGSRETEKWFTDRPLLPKLYSLGYNILGAHLSHFHSFALFNFLSSSAPSLGGRVSPARYFAPAKYQEPIFLSLSLSVIRTGAAHQGASALFFYFFFSSPFISRWPDDSLCLLMDSPTTYENEKSPKTIPSRRLISPLSFEDFFFSAARILSCQERAEYSWH